MGSWFDGVRVMWYGSEGEEGRAVGGGAVLRIR